MKVARTVLRGAGTGDSLRLPDNFRLPLRQSRASQSYSTVSCELVGSAWQVRITPAATSASVSAMRTGERYRPAAARFAGVQGRSPGVAHRVEDRLTDTDRHIIAPECSRWLGRCQVGARYFTIQVLFQPAAIFMRQGRSNQYLAQRRGDDEPCWITPY